jgi:secretion/DNA translocation related CpaE-like protein
VLVGHARDLPDEPLTRFAPAEDLGADHIAALPAAADWLVKRLRDARPELDAPVIAVLGGRGGAGASVLSGALAITGARRGLRTMLIDADPLGGGADLVLGWEQKAGLRWPALAQASGRVDADAFVGVLPGQDRLVALSADRDNPAAIPPEAMLAALDAGRRGRDLVVVDLPRRLDASAEIALAAADRAFLVVPAELRACAAARRVAATVLPHCPRLTVVVRRPGPAGLAPAVVAESIGLPLAGVMRNEARLAIALEKGAAPAISGRGPLAQLCTKLLTGTTRRSER